MLRRITWRSWAVIAVLMSVYFALGFAYDHNGPVETALYKWGLVAATLAVPVLIGVYTATGNRWWKNDIGSAITQLKLCILLLVAPLAWVFWKDNGMLLPSFLAWVEVSSPALVALALLRLCYVFWRVHRDQRRNK